MTPYIALVESTSVLSCLTAELTSKSSGASNGSYTDPASANIRIQSTVYRLGSGSTVHEAKHEAMHEARVT